MPLPGLSPLYFVRPGLNYALLQGNCRFEEALSYQLEPEKTPRFDYFALAAELCSAHGVVVTQLHRASFNFSEQDCWHEQDIYGQAG